MELSRRTFLQGLAASGAYASLGGWASVARAMVSRHADPSARFVLIRVHGAMDSTLGLHPHLGSMRGLDPRDLFIADGWDPRRHALRFNSGRLALGPAAAPLAPFANQLAVVRGIFMGPNDLGHPFAMQHASSGRTQESAPSWAAYLGRAFAAEGTSVITNAPLQRGTLQAFPMLLTSSLRAQAGQLAQEGQDPMLSLYQDPSLGANRLQEFFRDPQRISKFVDALRASPNPQAPSDFDVVASGLYAGLSRVAQIDLQPGQEGLTSIDTHSRHNEEHLPRQLQRWEMIARFLGRLKEMELLESTLVCVVTEFNRSPGLNSAAGKDHNYPDNAVALIGRGVRGGNTIGDRRLYRRSDGFPYAYWAGTHLHFGSRGRRGTGEVVRLRPRDRLPEGVDLIRPGDVWKSVAASFDERLVEQAPDDSKIIPNLFV